MTLDREGLASVDDLPEQSGHIVVSSSGVSN